VPAGEGQRVVDGDVEVVAEARVEVADLAVGLLDEKPEVRPAAMLPVVESDHCAFVWQQIPAQE
jgi:hypothetical protein